MIGSVSLANVGLAATRFLAERYGSARAQGERTSARAAAQRFHAGPQRGWSPGQRLAWLRWSPVLCALDGVERWSRAEQRAAVAVIRAKGGRHESDYARAFDAHRKLRAAVLALARNG